VSRLEGAQTDALALAPPMVEMIASQPGLLIFGLKRPLTGRYPPHIQQPLTATPPCAADAIQCFSSSSGRSHPGQLAGKKPASVERKLCPRMRCLTFESEERETWTAVSLRDQLERVGPFER
jgi:hypothetical protein